MFDADDITGTKIQGPQDLFDIRGTLLQKTNPLRTKILIFSTIYRQFDFSDRDWLTLKTQDLDSLLRHLFEACPTLNELEERLNIAARELEGADENIRSVRVLVRCFASFYQPNQPRETFDALSPSESSANASATSSSNFSSNVAEEVEDIEAKRSLEEPPTPIEEEDEEPDEEHSCVLWEDSSLEPSVNLENSSPEAEADRSYWRDFSPSPSPRLADRLLQHLATNDRVRELVRLRSRDLTDTIAQGIADLEGQLDDEPAFLDAEEQIHVKHDAVKYLLDDLRANLDRMGRILERQIAVHLLHVTPSPAADPDLVFKDQARRGSPKAIADWLDRRFKHQGITVLATQKERCLHVFLELSDISDPAELSATIRQNILELNLTTVDRIEIHGRKPGLNTVEWTRTIEI